MSLRQALLVHEVHNPSKLAADISASIVSIARLWRGHRRLAAAVHLGLPVLGSATVLAAADLYRLATIPAGRYVQYRMPPAAQALRLAGDALTMRGARRHCPAPIAAGLAVVAGLVPRPATRPRHQYTPTNLEYR